MKDVIFENANCRSISLKKSAANFEEHLDFQDEDGKTYTNRLPLHCILINHVINISIG